MLAGASMKQRAYRDHVMAQFNLKIFLNKIDE